MSVNDVADEPPDPRNHVRRVGRGGSLNLGAAAVSAVLGILLAIVVTRSFDKNEAGLYFAATSLALLAATVSRLGTPVGVVYWISRLRSQGRLVDARDVLRIALTPVLVLAVSIGAAMVVLAPQLGQWLFDGATGATSLLRVLGLLLPALAVSDVLMGATRGFGTMRTTALVDRTLRPAMQLALMLAAAASGVLVFSGLAWSLPYVVTTVVAAWWLGRLLAQGSRQVDPTDAGDPGLRRAFWSFTWPRGFTSLVQAGLQRLDVVLVSALRSPAEAAVYAVATRFLVVGQLTNSALGLAAQPQLASLIARGDRGAANDLYRTTTAWIVLMNGPLYLVVGAFSPLLLRLFGTQYTDAWPVTVVLCVAAFLGNAVGMVDVMLSMAGRTTWNLGNAVLALTVQVGLDLLLIPTYGAFGAAVGWGASILLANFVPLTQLAVYDGIHPFGPGTAWAIGLVLVTVGVPVLLALVVLGQSWAALIAALVVAGAAFGTGLYVLRVRLHVTDLVDALRRRSPSQA